MANPDRPSVPPHRTSDRVRSHLQRYQVGQGFDPFPRAGEQKVEPDLRKTTEKPTFVRMEPASKEYVDLKLDAALAPILAKLDSIEKNQISPWQVWGAALTGFGAVLAVLAFGSDQFGLGSGLSDQRFEQLQLDQAQDQKLDAVISRIDALLDAQATPAAPALESPTE